MIDVTITAPIGADNNMNIVLHNKIRLNKISLGRLILSQVRENDSEKYPMTERREKCDATE